MTIAPMAAPTWLLKVRVPKSVDAQRCPVSLMIPICPNNRIIPKPLPMRTSDGKTMIYVGCRDAAVNHHTMLSTMRVHPINVSNGRVSLYCSRKRWASRCNVIKGIVSASMPMPISADERSVFRIEDHRESRHDNEERTDVNRARTGL